MRIGIADDDKLVCLSLKTIIEADPDLQVVGVAADGEKAVTLYTTLLPDILLLDIRMAGLSGLEAGKLFCTSIPRPN
jgi:DNA-binding NarL/FixJ family response regulator